MLFSMISSVIFARIRQVTVAELFDKPYWRYPERGDNTPAGCC